MRNEECVRFLQWALPQLNMRWSGFRKVRKQVCKRVDRRRVELGMDSVERYQAYLQQNPEEWDQLDSLCRITISRFHRDKGVFAVLAQDAGALLRGGTGGQHVVDEDDLGILEACVQRFRSAEPDGAAQVVETLAAVHVGLGLGVAQAPQRPAPAWASTWAAVSRC